MKGSDERSLIINVSFLALLIAFINVGGYFCANSPNIVHEYLYSSRVLEKKMPLVFSEYYLYLDSNRNPEQQSAEPTTYRNGAIKISSGEITSRETKSFFRSPLAHVMNSAKCSESSGFIEDKL